MEAQYAGQSNDYYSHYNSPSPDTEHGEQHQVGKIQQTHYTLNRVQFGNLEIVRYRNKLPATLIDVLIRFVRDNSNLSYWLIAAIGKFPQFVGLVGLCASHFIIRFYWLSQWFHGNAVFLLLQIFSSAQLSLQLTFDQSYRASVIGEPWQAGSETDSLSVIEWVESCVSVYVYQHSWSMNNGGNIYQVQAEFDKIRSAVSSRFSGHILADQPYLRRQ